MPAKNAIKEYEAGAYYHIYNRGVEKRIIFQDNEDYKTFLSYLKFYLSPPEIETEVTSDLRGLSSQVIKTSPSKVLKNYQEEIELLAYCLMPNHFHLLVKQNSDYSIGSFMSSLSTKYVRYFNTRHKRVGHLFQDRYKAVKIDSEEQWIYLSKYIHRNPCEDSPRRSLSDYPYSSYANYLEIISQPWLKPDAILSHFSKKFYKNSYQYFVEQSSPEDITHVAPYALDIE
jgi:putative transposase